MAGWLERKPAIFKDRQISSRGGLVVELWTDNSLQSATVGSTLRQVWCINRSVEETLCYEVLVKLSSSQISPQKLKSPSHFTRETKKS